MVIKKGYQSTEEVSSIITTKVKGQGYISRDEKPPKEINLTDENFFKKLNFIDPNKEYRVFDTAGMRLLLYNDSIRKKNSYSFYSPRLCCSCFRI